RTCQLSKVTDVISDQPQSTSGVRGGAGAMYTRMWSLLADQKFWWVILSLAAIIPFAAVEFPPLYDYYHWLFQAHVLKALLVGGAPSVEPVSVLYGFNWTPVPNLAAPISIALLHLLLPLSVAGRVFLALCVLLFAYGFAYLVRSIQRQPTAIEFLGLLWAFGYFMY